MALTGQPRALLLYLLAALLGGAAGWLATAPHPGTPLLYPGPEATTAAAPINAQPRFVDVGSLKGVDLVVEGSLLDFGGLEALLGGGICLFDYDLDDDLDLYCVHGGGSPSKDSPPANRLYRNEGGWRFTDVTRQAGAGGAGKGQGCCTGDYDLDGDIDLHVTSAGPNLLYRNEGDGSFLDVSASAGVSDPGWGQSCAFLDQDRDGWPDLYVVNYLERPEADRVSPASARGAAGRLYRNGTDGTFRDATRESGLFRPGGKGTGLVVADLNGDGFTEVFVANDGTENHLFFGRPGGQFEEGALEAGVAFDEAGSPRRSLGADAGDADGDGDLDLLVPCIAGEGFTLYSNQGLGQFSDASDSAGLVRPTAGATGFGAIFLDHDSDGHLDIFAACGGLARSEHARPAAGVEEAYGMRDLLLVNDGRGHFRDLSLAAGSYFQERRVGRGAAAGDLDGDGDLDIAVINQPPSLALLRNDTPQGHWILVSVRDAAGRREPLGVEIRLRAGGREHRRTTAATRGHCSEGDRRFHFGLGDAATIESLRILWPDGSHDETKGYPADLHYIQSPRAFLRTPRRRLPRRWRSRGTRSRAA